MSDDLTFTEEVSYGCSPPEVLAAMGRINARIEHRNLDDPGMYEQTDITAQWMSQNLRSNWRLSVTLKRVAPEPEAPVPAKALEREYAGKTEEIEVNRAEPEQQAASVHGGDKSLPKVRKESRSSAVSGS